MGVGSQMPLLKTADVVLIVNAKVAWIPVNRDKDSAYECPSETARVYVIDSSDPLKQGTGMHHNEADLVCHADTAVAITQIQEAIGIQPVNEWSNRAEQIQKLHCGWKPCLHAVESFLITPSEPGSGCSVLYMTPLLRLGLVTSRSSYTESVFKVIFGRVRIESVVQVFFDV